MAKAAKIPPANGDTSSPKKGAGGSTQKYKPSPQKTSPKKEGKKPKIVNLKHPDGTCYGWAFFHFYNAKEELKSLSKRWHVDCYWRDQIQGILQSDYKVAEGVRVSWVDLGHMY